MSRPDPQQQVAEWRQRLASGGQVEVRIDRARSLLVIGVAVFFAAGGVALALSGNWVGWLCSGVACIGLVIVITRVVRPGVIIDRRSIRYEPWHVDVSWSELDDARCWSFRGNKLVQLTVGPDFYDAHHAKRPPIVRLLLLLDRRFVGPTINLPTPLAADGEVLAEWLTAEADARREDTPEPA